MNSKSTLLLRPLTRLNRPIRKKCLKIWHENDSEHDALIASLSSKKFHLTVGSSALVASFGTSWLFTFPKNKNCSKRMSIIWYFWYSMACGQNTESTAGDEFQKCLEQYFGDDNSYQFEIREQSLHEFILEVIKTMSLPKFYNNCRSIFNVNNFSIYLIWNN